jgi:hypothetical protein
MSTGWVAANAIVPPAPHRHPSRRSVAATGAKPTGRVATSLRDDDHLQIAGAVGYSTPTGVNYTDHFVLKMLTRGDVIFANGLD